MSLDILSHIPRGLQLLEYVAVFQPLTNLLPPLFEEPKGVSQATDNQRYII